MILMVVAIVCGLGASYMTSRLLAERDETPQPQAPVEIPKVKILVAKHNLDHGAAIKNPQEMFVEKSVNQEDAPKEVVTDYKLLKNKFLKHSLRKNDHVSVDDLMDEKASILARLPDGYQAYGFQADSAATASGWASLPGSKVNLLWTRKCDNDKQSFCKILMEDVLVLAADTQSKVLEDGKAMPASVVTVALKTKDTMLVKLAQQYGSLTLTLRKYGDNGPPPEHVVVNAEELFKTQPERLKKVKLNKDGTPELSEVDPNLPDVLNNKGTEVAPPKRYFHVVNFRQGEKQWRQVIEVDARGVPIQDDVQGEAPPALDAPPPPPGDNPPARNKDDNGPVKGSTK